MSLGSEPLGAVPLGTSEPTAITPIAVNDSYDVTAGVQLVVPAVTGILANDSYTCS